MLARLLQITIAIQMAFGAAVAYGLFTGFGRAAEVTGLWLGCALAMPLIGNLASVIYSCARAPSNGRAALWWKALAGECRANIQLFLLRQPWANAAPSIQPQRGTTARVPVLLVHGLVCNHRVWDFLAPALRARGHAVLAINLEPLFTSIDDYAPQIEQAVQALRQHSGQDKVALVGHSMGGVAIRAWIRRYGSAHVARAITLGAPHVGTQVRALVKTANGEQMAWNSPWLQAQAATESADTRALFRIALTAQDNIVYPQGAQTLPGVTPKVFEGLGHLQLCCAPEVRQWVCAQLELG